MKKWLIYVLLAFPSISFGDINQDIAKCAAIEGSGERITCYDHLAKKLGLDKPAVKNTAGNGKWKVQEQTSKIDDSTNVHVYLDSNDTVQGSFGKHRPKLYLRCKENKTEAFITIGLYLGLEETEVLTRLDKEKAIKSSWSLSTDSKAVFVSGSDIGFAKNLMKRQNLLVQVTPYGDSPVTFEFDIGGLSEAITPLRTACHW